MSKLDSSRNYYADLELPPTASVHEIKSQFKKLALKYHPDRNPGREDEFNPKFQAINSAHEILADETLKRKYDDSLRSRSRFPGASGVRGNPWQDAAKNYPPPPRRQAGGAAGGPSNRQSGQYGRGAAPNVPPRPPPAAPTSARPPRSGASRYSDFAGGSSRPSKAGSKDDAETRKYNAQAWDSMRPPGARDHAHRPPPPPPPPPGQAPTSATRDSRTSDSESGAQTASQRQKAQASFGNSQRRTGYTPRYTGLGDEPPVTNKNYYTDRTHTNIFQETSAGAARKNRRSAAAPDPLAPFRDTLADERISSPYHTPGGEKTKLFDDEDARTNPYRSTGAPHPGANGEAPGTSTFPFPRQRQRSSSAPRSSSNDGGSEDSNGADGGPSGGGRRAANSNNAGHTPWNADRYKPGFSADVGGTPAAANAGQNRDNANTNAEHSGAGVDYEPYTYGTPSPSKFTSHCHPGAADEDPQDEVVWKARLKSSGLYDRFQFMRQTSQQGTSSGESKDPKPKLSPFEKVLKSNVERLIDRKKSDAGSSKSTERVKDSFSSTATYQKSTVTNRDTNSFTFSIPDDGTDRPQKPRRFASTSAENINTRFTQDEYPDDWQFTAGSASANEASTQSHSRASPAGRTYARARTTTRGGESAAAQTQEGVEENAAAGFSAGEWSSKIGSQHFVPPADSSASASPTRRTNPRKNSKPVKMTAGTAGLVDDESSAGEGWQEFAQPSATDSPNAMDIDTPPAEKVDDTPKASAGQPPRTVRVEPSNPQWRAGDVDGGGGLPKTAAHPTVDTSAAKLGTTAAATAGSATATSPINPFATRTGGSEDTDDFRTNFADFQRVEPFAKAAPSGLKSFADMKSTLPFESQASQQIPIEREAPANAGALPFPVVPVAPRLPHAMFQAGVRPSGVQFRQYADSFYQYLEQWETFNQMVLDHFAARHAEQNVRRLEKPRSWLEAAGGEDGARRYQVELDQDHEVRRQWSKACDEHQMRVREFTAFRDRIK